MTQVIERILYFGPLIFAFGFLMPLFMQILIRTGWALPFNLTPLMAAAIAAGLLGLAAQIRGRWV